LNVAAGFRVRLCGLVQLRLRSTYRQRRAEIFSENEFLQQLEKMKSPGSEMPQVVVKWYAYAKWVLERVEGFPKSQRFILGQRLSNHVMDVLETLVKASYARDKMDLLRQANEGIEMTRWVVRMAHDRKLLAAKQFEFSAVALNECGRMGKGCTGGDEGLC
jgi:hypothetical protein